MTIYMQQAVKTAQLPMSEAERKARVQLAACYRVFDMLGWTEMIFNHITLRVPGPEPRFLINPFGLHYREVKASNLVLIDLDGNILRDTGYPINRAGFVIHSAIHGSMRDAHCVMHTHTTNGVAVSCLKAGLSSDNFYGAMLHGRVAYHDLEGVTVDTGERERIVRDLGDKHVMVLRNHGLLSWGESVAEAYLRLWTLQRACDVQLATAQAGGETIRLPQAVIDRMLAESGPGEKRTCEDVFAALVRLVDARDPSYRD
ncbi:MAG TPA: class II aldolase/adducin family protein [Burkholderiales bacterium]|nr:class II aldolase/adducin family protein [Burkholderiales bacterium]